jgi:ABC-type molybdenum transport system ATPase subunit/photorepair protein PhrA
MFSEDKLIINTKRYAAYQRMVSETGAFEIYETKAAGLPVTHVENNQIVKEYADGRKEILGTVRPPVKVKKRCILSRKNMTNWAKRLRIFAGPNGSGKSTLYEYMVRKIPQ